MLDLALCNKIINRFSVIYFDSLFALPRHRNQRGYRFQLACKTFSLNNVLYNFRYRVMRVWNCFPENVAEAFTVLLYKNDLLKYHQRNAKFLEN